MRPRLYKLCVKPYIRSRNLATVAATGVWMHFFKRVQSHVRNAFALSKAEYSALSKDEKNRRRLQLTLQVAADLCRSPTTDHQSPSAWHEWVVTERAKLGIDVDEAVGDWKGKPLLYHLKARPQCTEITDPTSMPVRPRLQL